MSLRVRKVATTMAVASYNWFLIIVAVVVSLLAIGVAVYILITYQHPEDKNQAWLPKIVFVFGVSLAIWTVLLFPLDVGNRKACAANIAYSNCKFAIPTKALWYACYAGIGAMVGVIIPFSIFYYEADSELCALASLWLCCCQALLCMQCEIIADVPMLAQVPWQAHCECGNLGRADAAGVCNPVWPLLWCALVWPFCMDVCLSMLPKITPDADRSVATAWCVSRGTGFAGYVTFSVTSATSGMAPLSALAATNSTALDECIFPGTGPATPRYVGTLVSLIPLLSNALPLALQLTGAGNGHLSERSVTP